LWSQLYRTQRAILSLLHNNDFTVLKSAAWSDERNLSVLLFELSSEQIPTSKRHLGPPVHRAKESLAFLQKHRRRRDTLAGPWIENDRWMVEKKRSETSASALLKTALASGGARIGVASVLQAPFKRRLTILKDAQMTRIIHKNHEFAKFMRTYLSGRPTWLE